MVDFVKMLEEITDKQQRELDQQLALDRMKNAQSLIRSQTSSTPSNEIRDSRALVDERTGEITVPQPTEASIQHFKKREEEYQKAVEREFPNERIPQQKRSPHPQPKIQIKKSQPQRALPSQRPTAPSKPANSKGCGLQTVILIIFIFFVISIVHRLLEAIFSVFQ